MAQIVVNKGKISATYKDTVQGSVTEPLAYTKFNLADSAASISAYIDDVGSEVSIAKSTIAGRILAVGEGIAALSQNTFDSMKIAYDVKLIN